MNKDQHEDWNPRDESILKDQRRSYDEIREKCPVAHSEFMGWSLFRHADITAVLADPETFSNVSVPSHPERDGSTSSWPIPQSAQLLLRPETDEEARTTHSRGRREPPCANAHWWRDRVH